MAELLRVKRWSDATPKGQEVLNTAEAAQLLRVHPVTRRKKAVSWGVPHKRLGTEWRFSRSVLLAWLKGEA